MKLENIEVKIENEKLKNDSQTLAREIKDFDLENYLLKEILLKVKREKTAIELQKNASENLLIQEKAKVENVEMKILILIEEKNSTNFKLEEFKLSMSNEFVTELVVNRFVWTLHSVES